MASVGKKLYMNELSKEAGETVGGFSGLLTMVIWFAKKYPKQGLLAMSLILLSTAAEGFGLAAIIPLLSGVLSSSTTEPTTLEIYINNFLSSIGVTPNVESLIGVLIFAVFLKAILRFFGLRTVGFFAADISKGIREDVLEKIASVEWSYFVANKTGEIAAALTHAAEKTSSTGMQIAKFFAVLFQVIVVLALSAAISVNITLLALAVGIVTFVLLGGFVRMARAAGAEQTDIMNGFTSRLLDSIGAIKPIKAMGSEKRILPLLNHDVDDLNRTQKKLVYSSVMLDVMPEPISAVAISFAFLAILNADVSISQPEVMLGLMVLFTRALMSLHMMQGIYKTLAAGQAAFWFINTMITRLDKHREHAKGNILHALQDKIVLHNVDFSYGEKKVVDNVSVTIPVGKIITVTGGSGAGKTTLLDLIIGLMQPDSGEIIIDDVKLENIDKQNWREQIGYVPQDTFMFHDTVFSNITLGDTSIGRSEVRNALIDAEAIDFVEQLEKGMDTIVGEKGMMLSGGQRQRLAIARSLARSPKLLILDEATSSLDPDSEHSICETLMRLRKEKDNLTILAISHQPALVEIADIVYTVKDGKLNENDFI